MKINQFVIVVFLFILMFFAFFSPSAQAVALDKAVLSDAHFIKAFLNQDIQSMNDAIIDNSQTRSWRLTWEHYHDPGIEDTWDYNQRYHYGYLNRSYIQEVVGQFKIAEVWNNQSRMTYTYNEDIVMQTCLYENWEEETWVNSIKISYAYDEGLCTEIIGQNWFEGEWQNFYRILYTYNDDGNLSTTESQASPAGNWVNSGKSVYTYNTDDLVSEIQNYVYGGGWLPYSRTLYTYTNFGKTQSTLYQIWSATSSQFIDSSRSTFTYNVNEQNTSTLTEIFQNSNWNNSSLVTMSYDANGNLAVRITETWNVNAWSNTKKITYEYEQDTAIEDDTVPEINNLFLSVYPNPFSQNTTINIKSETAGKAALNIYNLKGQLVKSTGLNLSKDKTINWQWNENGSAGIYFVEVRQDNQVLKSMKLVRY